MIRSVRFSLTVWYVGILTVILCVFGAILFTSVKTNLFRTIDALLTAEADGVEDAIYSFWKAESKNSSEGVKVLPQFRDEIAAGHLPALILRWGDETDELDTSRPVRILSGEGQSLAESPILTKWFIPLNAADFRQGGKRKSNYETYRLSDDKYVRLLTHPVTENGQVLYFIQVAVSLHQADLSLERLLIWLLVLIPVTVFVTCLVGWFLASLILRPIGRMTRQVHELSESRLHKRLDVPNTGDELQRLAVTFNEMLDRFEKGFKRLRQFSAAASHELRTPLTVMKGEIELALLRERSEEEYRKVLRNQLSVVHDMVHVVEQLLAVAHAEDGEIAVRWDKLCLDDLARSVAKNYADPADKKNITIEIIAPHPVPVRGEKSLLERLIANLLENAIKHTPPQGRVKLEMVEQDREVRLTVTDTGKGIPSEDVPKIFDKFFDKKVSSGGIVSTGIGLGLCRWIAELHKGIIEVGNAPGAGARFTVSFPILSK